MITTLKDSATERSPCFNRKGIHPGAHIVLDLLLSGALFGCGISDVLIWHRPEVICEGICPNITNGDESLGLGGRVD